MCRSAFIAMVVAWGGVLPSTAVAVAPDVLVVCPAEFRAALAPWETYRRSQGHELLVVEPPAAAAQLQATVRRVAQSGRLEYLVLIGDVASADAQRRDHVQKNEPSPHPSLKGRGIGATTVPTQYVRARVNTRWGSEPWIATDQLYADTDGDQVPDLAVGRIPADSADELAAVVRKVLRYEQQPDHGLWQRRIEVVAGQGGFGRVADALVEAAGRQVLQQTIPAGYTVGQMWTNPNSPHAPPPGEICPLVRRQLGEGCLAWVYLGHGWYSELDRVATPAGERPLLCLGDVPHLECGAESPLAVLVACYTGAIDAPQDCLGEELLLAEQGPVAVIAATRVSMPYGNAVLGCELLQACFRDEATTVGQMLRTARERTLADAPGDALRMSLDGLARGLSPPPVDLATERREHVMMYQLLGDPLLRLRRPHELPLEIADQVVAGEVLTIDGRSSVPGECLVELVPSRERQADARPLASVARRVEAGAFQLMLTVPPEAVGAYTVRAFVAGQQSSALGAASVVVARPASERVARGGAEQQRQ
jgi:hypothetical protein